MTWRRKALAMAGAYLATLLVLIPLIWSIIYLLSFVPPPGAPQLVVYIALGLCIMTGVGLLRWFRMQIESRMS